MVLAKLPNYEPFFYCHFSSNVHMLPLPINPICPPNISPNIMSVQQGDWNNCFLFFSLKIPHNDINVLTSYVQYCKLPQSQCRVGVAVLGKRLHIIHDMGVQMSSINKQKMVNNNNNRDIFLGIHNSTNLSSTVLLLG